MTSYEELAEAVHALHRPRNTAAGLRCSTCATWEGYRLKRSDWPCATILLVTPPRDENYYASGGSQ